MDIEHNLGMPFTNTVVDLIAGAQVACCIQCASIFSEVAGRRSANHVFVSMSVDVSGSAPPPRLREEGFGWRRRPVGLRRAYTAFTSAIDEKCLPRTRERALQAILGTCENTNTISRLRAFSDAAAGHKYFKVVNTVSLRASRAKSQSPVRKFCRNAQQRAEAAWISSHLEMSETLHDRFAAWRAHRCERPVLCHPRVRDQRVTAMGAKQ